MMMPEVIQIHEDEDEDEIWQCCDCGAYIVGKKENLTHHKSCVPGEAERWKEHYANEL